jgi:hypothetical protein
MEKRIFVVVTIVVGLLFLSGGAGLYAQQAAGTGEYVQQMGSSGSVNWSEGTITAVGVGAPPERFYGKPQARPMAMRAAQVDAYRKLLETAQGVRVDSTTLVREYVVESDVVKTQVEGIVRGAQVVKTEYLSDGTVEVTASMPLSGTGNSLSQAIYPRIMTPSALPPAPPTGLPATVPAVPATPGTEAPATPATPATPAPATPASEVFTGLVIDARGIQARPAMSPKVLDENGEEVYGSMHVDREYAVQQGMSGYARDLTAAQSNARVTNNPLTVKGVKTEGPGKSNIVISNADASQLRAAAENLTFLKKCRVMIVLD